MIIFWRLAMIKTCLIKSLVNYLVFFLFYSKNKTTQKQKQTLLFQSIIHFVDSKTLQARIIWHQRQNASKANLKIRKWYITQVMFILALPEKWNLPAAEFPQKYSANSILPFSCSHVNKLKLGVKFFKDLFCPFKLQVFLI